VVVVGGGFGGLQAVKALRGAPVEVTLIDRNDHHLFQPLSYQVATGALSPDEIAEPLRTIFRTDRRVRVMMAEVIGVDAGRGVVELRPAFGDGAGEAVPYETLVVAAGSEYSYAGHEEWRPFAPDIKSLDRALGVRTRILGAFEAAELAESDEDRARWLTFVVVGGGPTGVEMAGQIAELARGTVAGGFRLVDPRAAQVVLVEFADRVLTTFPAPLSSRAGRSLERLGVAVRTRHMVVGIDAGGVDVGGPDGATQRLPARTVVWAAGVTASPLARALAHASGAELDRAGRVIVEPDLTLRGHPDVLALGDMVAVRDARTGAPRTLPGLAPVAMQEGRYAARLIRDRLDGRSSPPFRYRDKGQLATIGRAQAVADIGGLRLSGLTAWVIWLAVHLFYLIGFENRAVVLVRWAYYFFTHGRGARVIVQRERG
jgi:NADH dehydrogenase